jgi:hypothetical protein
MKTFKVISSKGNEYTFYRLPNYDINGNARYVIHFPDLLTAEEFKAIPVLKAYELAAQSVKGFARRYNCRAFGGGFVFHSVNYKDTADYLDGCRESLPLTSSAPLNNLISDIYADILDRICTETGYFSNVAAYIKDPEITVTWGTVRHAGTKFIWYGNLLTGYYQVRQLLLKCGFKCEKWSDDTVYKKYCDAADIVLHWIHNNFTYTAI